MPMAKYQWFKDGKAIQGANNSILKIDNAKSKDSGNYSVSINNNSGNIESTKATLLIN